MNTLLNGHPHKVRPWHVYPRVGKLRHVAPLGSAGGNRAACRFGRREAHGLCFGAQPGAAGGGAEPSSLPAPSLCLLLALPRGGGVPLGGLSPASSVPPVPQLGESSDTFSTFDVPIFTEEFLDQNKGEGLGCGPGATVAAAASVGPAQRGGHWGRGLRCGRGGRAEGLDPGRSPRVGDAEAHGRAVAGDRIGSGRRQRQRSHPR